MCPNTAQTDEMITLHTAKTQKWKLLGYDTFEGGEDAFYPLPGAYVTEAEAIQAALARLVELEYSQPSHLSGGQNVNGVQDHVYIVGPTGNRTRILPPKRTR